MLFGQRLGRGHARRHNTHSTAPQRLLKFLGERFLIELLLAQPLQKILHLGLAFLVTLVDDWDAFDGFSY